MTIKTLAITDFLPPATEWGEQPTMPMPLGDDCTALAACSDGALLAILHLKAYDILSAIKNNSLFDHMAALKNRSPWAYLLISGTLEPGRGGMARIDGGDTKWTWTSVQGALATVQELGVVVMLIPDEADVGPAIHRLSQRERGIKRLGPLRSAMPLSPAEQIILSLPGVGEANLFKILGYTGTVKDALMALTAPGVDVPGIGQKTKAAIRDALGLKSDEYMVFLAPGDQVVSASAEQKAA